MKKNMKKMSTPALLMAAMTVLMLCACIPEDEGYTYQSQFARIVTIDHKAEPPRFYCDYTGEVLELSNIPDNAALATYKLENVDRALINVLLTASTSNYDIQLTSGSAIEVHSVSKKEPVFDNTFHPIYGFSQFQVDASWAYPYGWVSRGYLSIIPQIMSNRESTKQYLVPEAVSNDTLSFSLYMSYEPSETLRAEYLCYDLRTLKDTTDADASVKESMAAMNARLDRARSDSVMVVVVADFQRAYPDTVVKVMVPTNSFYYPFD